MNPPLVSIVMICWNRKDDVWESLNRIGRQTFPNVEVIVVDNCSKDGTPAMIEREFPEVRLIRMFKNVGIEAYNIGFANARGEYLVVLDDDSFPHEDAITRMVRKFEADGSLGAVAFDVRNFYNYDELKREEKEEQDQTVAGSGDYLMSFNGAGVGVRREVFEQAGYYPEEFFLYWNEQDAAFRILDAGYRIHFFADVVAYHKYSPQNRTAWRAPFYYTRNAYWLIWKNYPTGMAVKQTLAMVRDCIYHSVEQKTLIYVKAMLAAFGGAGRLKGKRKPVDAGIAKNLRIPLYTAFTFFR